MGCIHTYIWIDRVRSAAVGRGSLFFFFFWSPDSPGYCLMPLWAKQPHQPPHPTFGSQSFVTGCTGDEPARAQLSTSTCYWSSFWLPGGLSWIVIVIFLITMGELQCCFSNQISILYINIGFSVWCSRRILTPLPIASSFVSNWFSQGYLFRWLFDSRLQFCCLQYTKS